LPIAVFVPILPINQKQKKVPAMRIKEMTPQQLRDFVQRTDESAFVLIDVRQPGEYEQAHIPGARLLPLPELIQTMDTLPHDRSIVFYCRSGGRSMAAATMAEETSEDRSRIYNLTGGMLAWDGAVAADFPRVGLFDRGATPLKMMEIAMNLEKGALLFYSHVAKRYEHEDWSRGFEKLAAAERAHARTVYGYWSGLGNQPDIEPFESLFESLAGDMLEGGLSLEDALSQAGAVGESACVRLVELALSIEYAAYDLYRTMADQSLAPEPRQGFFKLAQAEKAHMHALAKSLDECPV
jgi:rhodanese-related sulfurtransferase/rubrerythrin